MRAILLAVLLLAGAGCGARGDPVAASSASVAPPSAERLLIEGPTATTIVQAGTGAVISTLPGGVVSPTKALVLRVTTAAGETALAGVDLGGRPVLDLSLPGAYGLPAAYGPAPSGFSPNGRWLVLVERGVSESRFAVVDVAHARVAKTVTLSSRFTFDAIHNDGSALYLIEHPDAATTKYNVRFYDVAAGALAPEIVFDKAALAGPFDPTVGIMDGAFHVSVAPTDRDWTYGLYVRANGTPFVHALNVPGRYAHCILDLAGRWTPASMYAMALSADGRRLYVVDPVAGSASAIDGLTQKVAAKASFATKGGPGDPRAASAVVSRDGGRLYATAPRGIAVLQTTDLSLRAWLAPELAARSLAVSSDGSQLYALAGGEIAVVDARSGAVLARYPAPDGARAVHLLPRDAVGRISG